jgi:NADH:ubiquinone oxidoreductase subunit 2 (subunit N)
MNAPLLWIVFPAAMGLAFWFTREKRGRTIAFASLLCLFLALLARVLPIGDLIRLGPLSFTVDSTLAFAGRRLVLENSDRAFLVFIFLLSAYWFIGSYAAGVTSFFIPLGLGVISLLIASLAVEPLLYAALLVEMAVLLVVPILAPPGTMLGQGVLRFIIFQTLAMPFILMAGWAMAGVENNPSNSTLVLLSIIFLALGFAFWLAVFPFYTWIPMLAEQTIPYSSGFVFLLLPTVCLLLGQGFLDRFGWMQNLPGFFQVIGQLGLLMIVTAGTWAVFQKELARVFGYAMIVEGGFSLLAASLNSTAGQQMFSSMFLPRMLSAGLWAFSLSILRSHAPSTRFDDMKGIAQKLPFASAGVGVSSLTLAGLPLLGVFPIRLTLMELVAQASLLNALLALAGMVGMLFATFRVMAVLSSGWLHRQPFLETRFQVTLIVMGIGSLIFVGLLPQVFYPMMYGLVSGASPLP